MPCSPTSWKLTSLVFLLVTSGCPHWSRSQRWSLHPDIDPDAPRRLGDRLGVLLLLRALPRHPLSLHPPVRDPYRRPQGPHRRLLRHLPPPADDAVAQDRRQRVHPRAFPRTHVRLQGRRPPIPRQPVRILPQEEERPQTGGRGPGEAHHRRRDLWRHRKVSLARCPIVLVLFKLTSFLSTSQCRHLRCPRQGGHLDLHALPDRPRFGHPGGADDVRAG